MIARKPPHSTNRRDHKRAGKREHHTATTEITGALQATGALKPPEAPEEAEESEATEAI